MKRRFTRFWTLAMAGYGFVVLLLATGMILAVWRFDAIARGDDPRTIAQGWQDELEKFKEMRTKYLIYK